MSALPLLLKRKKSFITVFSVLFFLVIIRVFFFPVYEAETVIMVDIKQSPTSLESSKMGAAELMGVIRTTMSLLESIPVLRKVVEDLDLNTGALGEKKDLSPLERERSIRQAIEILQKRSLSIENPPFTNLIEIKVKYKNPDKAAQIANTLVQNFISWSTDFLHKEVKTLGAYLEKEVGLTKERLEGSEKNLEDFRNENKVIALPEEVKVRIERQARFESEYAATEILEKELSMTIRAMYQELDMDKSGTSDLSISTHPAVQAIEVQLLNLEIELGRLKELYTDTNLRVVRMEEMIAGLKEKLSQTVKAILDSKISLSTVNYVYQNLINELVHSETQLISAGAKKKALEEILKNIEAQLLEIPKEETAYVRLFRQVKVNETIYTLLLQEQEKARLLEFKETIENVKIVSPAMVPLKPKGRLTGLLIGFITSLMFSAGYVLMSELMREYRK